MPTLGFDAIEVVTNASQVCDGNLVNLVTVYVYAVMELMAMCPLHFITSLLHYFIPSIIAILVPKHDVTKSHCFH